EAGADNLDEGSLEAVETICTLRNVPEHDLGPLIVERIGICIPGIDERPAIGHARARYGIRVEHKPGPVRSRKYRCARDQYPAARNTGCGDQVVRFLWFMPLTSEIRMGGLISE